MKKILSALNLFCLCLSLLPLLAQPLEVKKIAIFKNGSAMMTKEGTCKVQQNQFTLPIPEQAVFGTYWLSSAKENLIKNLQFKNDTIKVKKAAASFAELLSSCKGTEVEIHYAPAGNLDKVASGTVLDIDDIYLTLGVIDDKGMPKPKYAIKHSEVQTIQSFEENDADLINEVTSTGGMVN